MKAWTLLLCALLLAPPVLAIPVAVFVAIGFSAGAALAASIIVNIGITIGLGFLQRALAPKPPKLRNELADRLVTVRQAISYRRWVAGTVGKLAGIITFFHQAEVSGAHYDYYVIALAGRRLSSIGNLYFDDELVPLDGSGNATGKYAGLVKVEKNLGSDDQAALSLLTTDVPSKWTSTHRQRGCAHVGLRLKFDQDKLPQTPNIRFDVVGPEVYDPRTGTFVVTGNGALQYADYLTDIRLGAGYSKRAGLASATITHSGLTVFDAAKVGDGDVTAAAWGVDSASAGAVLKVDLGAAGAKEFNWCKVYALAGGSAAQWKVQWSDDDAAWSDAQESILKPDVAGWKFVRLAGNGSHRYWRLRLENAPGAGPEFAEVEFYESEINRTQLIAAANTCDEDVDLAAGGTEKRYTINGTWTADVAPDGVLPALREAMGGWDAETQGGWKIYAGAYTAPTLTLTKADLRGAAMPLVVRGRRPKPELFNAVQGTFAGAVTDWQPAGLPEVTSVAYVQEDDGEKLAREAQLPFTTSAARGQRILKIALERNRRQKAVTWRGKLSCWRIEAGQTVALTVPELGWTSKPFLVTKFALVEETGGEGEGAGSYLGVDLELEEWDSTIFDWDETVDEQPFTAPPTITAPPVPLAPTLFPTGDPNEQPQVFADARLDGVVAQDAPDNRLWNNWFEGTTGSFAAGQPAAPTGYGQWATDLGGNGGFTANGEFDLFNHATVPDRVMQDVDWSMVGNPGEEFVFTVEVKHVTATDPTHDFKMSIFPFDGTTEGTPVEVSLGAALFTDTAYKQAVLKGTLPNMANITKYRIKFANLSTGGTAGVDGYRIRRAMLTRSVDIPRWISAVGRDRTTRQVTGGGGGGGGGGTGGGSGCEGGCVL